MEFEYLIIFLPLIGAIISGFFGGISGQWGPPLVIYFLSQNLSMKQIICYQGLTYSIASLALIGGHINSGVLSIELALLSIMRLSSTNAIISSS